MQALPPPSEPDKFIEWLKQQRAENRRAYYEHALRADYERVQRERARALVPTIQRPTPSQCVAHQSVSITPSRPKPAPPPRKEKLSIGAWAILLPMALVVLWNIWPLLIFIPVAAIALPIWLCVSFPIVGIAAMVIIMLAFDASADEANQRRIIRSELEKFHGSKTNSTARRSR